MSFIEFIASFNYFISDALACVYLFYGLSYIVFLSNFRKIYYSSIELDFKVGEETFSSWCERYKSFRCFYYLGNDFIFSVLVVLYLS